MDATPVTTQARKIPATMVDYSDRLQMAMDAAGVTVVALAKEIGVSRQAVKKVLEGLSSYFKLDTHYRACRFLGVRSEWLALGEEPVRPSEPAKPANADWRTLAMSIAAAHPHSDVREQLLDFCDRVDAQAAELQKLTDRRVKAHTP